MLLWRNEDPDAGPPILFTAETWIFDPATPERLHLVNAKLESNIFCSGMSWDATGVLVAAGGANPATPPAQTYRFFPEALVYPPIATPGSCEPWVVAGLPWRRVGDMSLERYYNTLMPALTGVIDGGTFPDIPSGSSFVVGGDPPESFDPDPQPDPPIRYPGNDFWQALPPNLVSSAWSHTLVAESDSIGMHPVPNEVYERRPDGDPMIPEADARLDYYPRGYHLATTGETAGEDKNFFIANDVFPEDMQVGDHPVPASNAAGHSWAMKPRYGPNPGVWQLWTGPFGGPTPSDPKERYWGGAVLLHTLDDQAPTAGINRVLLFGGLYDADPQPLLWHRVEELRATGPLQNPLTTTWETKHHCMLTGRYEHNTVVLPTGRILLIGGACDLDANGRAIPAQCPELYDPGDIGEPTGAMSWKMARRPSAPGSIHPYARIYHNLGVLMPNGSVFNAGGIEYTAVDPTHANGAFSGEIFYPPYYTHPKRPAIVTVSATQVMFGGPGFQVEVHHTGGYDPQLEIEKLVILRPAAVTHHFDPDQRYIELEWVSTGVDGMTGIETFQSRRPPTSSLRRGGTCSSPCAAPPTLPRATWLRRCRAYSSASTSSEARSERRGAPPARLSVPECPCIARPQSLCARSPNPSSPRPRPRPGRTTAASRAARGRCRADSLRSRRSSGRRGRR